jgi:hypothetical protein
MLTALTVATALTYDFATRGLYQLCSQTITGVAYLASNPAPGFESWSQAMMTTDIHSQLISIQQLEPIFAEHHTHLAIQTCFHDLTTVVSNINQIIEHVTLQQAQQKELYFGSWRFRSPDCSSAITALTLQSNLLNLRFQRLKEMVQLLKAMNSI